MKPGQYSLRELAEASATPPRTIRFYIARGLLPGPGRAGRNARYEDAHLERLRQIDELKQDGLTLVEIAARLEGGGEPAELPAPAPLAGLALADDVQALVRTDVPPWRARQVRRVLAEAARQLKTMEQPERK